MQYTYYICFVPNVVEGAMCSRKVLFLTFLEALASTYLLFSGPTDLLTKKSAMYVLGQGLLNTRSTMYVPLLTHYAIMYMNRP